MRILLLTHSFTPEISPPQRRWRAFVDAFAEAGHRVSVVTPRPQAKVPAGIDQKCGNFRVLRYPALSPATRPIFKALKHGIDSLVSIPSCLRAGRQDVVIATVPALPTLLIGFVASKLLRAHFVVDLRDAWPNLLHESKVLGSSRLEPVVSRFILSLLKRARLVVTVTQGLAAVARSQGVKNVITLPNGVEFGRYEGLQAPRGKDSRVLNVLYLGNLGRSQGLEVAIDAAAALPGTIRLRMVGGGSEAEALREYAAHRGAAVEFHQPVRGIDVLKMYQWADTCLVSLRPDWPSFDYTVPSKLYELLALDKHVTGLVRGEAAHIIEQAQAGAVVAQSAEALVSHLRSLGADRGSLLRTGSARRWVKNHADLGSLGIKYLAELEKLTENGR